MANHFHNFNRGLCGHQAEGGDVKKDPLEGVPCLRKPDLEISTIKDIFEKVPTEKLAQFLNNLKAMMDKARGYDWPDTYKWWEGEEVDLHMLWCECYKDERER